MGLTPKEMGVMEIEEPRPPYPAVRFDCHSLCSQKWLDTTTFWATGKPPDAGCLLGLTWVQKNPKGHPHPEIFSSSSTSSTCRPHSPRTVPSSLPGALPSVVYCKCCVPEATNPLHTGETAQAEGVYLPMENSSIFVSQSTSEQVFGSSSICRYL